MWARLLSSRNFSAGIREGWGSSLDHVNQGRAESVGASDSSTELSHLLDFLAHAVNSWRTKTEA